MAAPTQPTKINLKVKLKNTGLKDIMPDGWDAKENPVDKDKLLADLQAEIDKAGLSLERITSAPLTLRKTYGADVYKLIGLLQQDSPPAEAEAPAGTGDK